MASRFDVYVVPGSSRSGPDGRRGGVPRLRVRAVPEGGRANEEVLKVVRKLFGTPVRLVRGAGARTKTLEADLDAATLARMLEKVFGPG